MSRLVCIFLFAVFAAATVRSDEPTSVLGPAPDEESAPEALPAPAPGEPTGNEAPTADETTTGAPTAEDPATEGPATDAAPTADEPATEGPTADEATTAGDDVDEVESVVDQWRRTLTYGIDSEVLELLPQLRENERRDLSSEVMNVMEVSFNPEVRIEALKYFTELEIAEAAPLVTDVLSADEVERPAGIMRNALWYVERVVEEPSVELLAAVRDLVDDRDPQIASTAIRALGELGGDEDVEMLLELYGRPRTPVDVRQSILLALGSLGSAETETTDMEELLLSVAEDDASEATSRYYAIDSLSKIRSEAAVDLFRRLLSSEDAILRSYAIAALSRYEAEDVETTLVRALRDSFWRVRVSALEGIAEREAAGALPAVRYKVERDPEMRVRYEAIKTAAAIGTPEAWSFLRDLYKDPAVPVTVRNSIAEALIENNLDGSREVLATVIEQEWDRPNSTLLDYAAKKLSQTRAPNLDEFYAKFLTHPNFIIRIYGIRGIGLNGYDKFRDELQALAEQEVAHRAIRSNAQAAIEELDEPSADTEEGDLKETPAADE